MIRLSSVEDLTPRVIQSIVTDHNPSRIKRLKQYYADGQDKSSDNPVANYAAYITFVAAGYFLGKPITFTAAEGGEAFYEAVSDIFEYSDEQDHNAELGKEASQCGIAYEVLYMDGDSKVRLGRLPAEEVIPIYTDTIETDLLAVLRVYEFDDIVSKKAKKRLELYTDKETVYYSNDAGTLKEIERVSHPFKGVPVNPYKNNEEQEGDYEKVISLIDSYNKSQGNTATDMEDFTDAFLKLVNMSGTQKNDIDQAKRNKVLLLETDGDADWLTKQVNDTWVENYKNRLQNDIHIVSMVPRLTDEAFAGNITGEALKYKLWGIEQITASKERKFKRALQRRLELIANILEVKGKPGMDFRTIKITFTRNLPAHVAEAADTVGKLSGVLSQETLISMIPGVENPAEEYQKYLAEREANSAYTGWAPAPADPEPEGDE
ncbi:Phage portal protein, SPP1 Gp6-like [compost metagenome]